MRVVFDNEGYLKEWILKDDCGFISNEKEQVIPTPENLDISTFYNEYHLYHLVNGNLVKDENRQAQLENKNLQKKRVLSLQEKLKLFIETLPVDEQPDYKDGIEYKPYFDKDNMKFAWKSVMDVGSDE